MQGFIIDIKKVKNEDLIVSILTAKKLKTLYRFYGARHSHINLGYKIDFEIQTSSKSTIDMLRNVLVLNMQWMLDNSRFYVWQRFSRLLYQHLRDVTDIDPFYFNLLDTASTKILKQNPKRVIIEAYLELLYFEGRLHDDLTCFICEKYIDDSLVLTRSFLPTHSHCINQKGFEKEKIETLFENKTTLHLEDSEVEILWDIVLEGI